MIDQSNGLTIAALHGNRGEGVDGLFLQYNPTFGW
jgi:hypothetical protein